MESQCKVEATYAQLDVQVFQCIVFDGLHLKLARQLTDVHATRRALAASRRS